ncbi:Serpentine Receptor, class T [Ditylenchus destructor]|uniref:Serpentine Receptor, class T n=1 Tax=Ditylenchus destructor TaxID=166010 RepID=A0AAD4MLB7_9BILA|nr:Serpentine Receptor, class T [Ditylenchus destructor]
MPANATTNSTDYDINVLLMTTNSQTENTIVGLSLILSAIFIFSLNVIVIRAINHDKELNKLNSYRFLLWMAYSDSSQMGIYLITGFWTIYPCTWSVLGGKLLGICPQFIFYAFVTTVLASHRMVALLCPNIDSWMFSKRGMKVWLYVSLFVASLFAIGNGLPWSTMLYNPSWWTWGYDGKLPMSGLVSGAAMYLELIGITIAFLFHIPMFLVIYQKRKVGALGKKASLQDFKILIQAFTITAYSFLSNMLFYAYPVFRPEDKYAFWILNMFNVYNSAVNPVMYMIMNNSLRKKVKTVVSQAARSRNVSFVTQTAISNATSSPVMVRARRGVSIV